MSKTQKTSLVEAIEALIVKFPNDPERAELCQVILETYELGSSSATAWASLTYWALANGLSKPAIQDRIEASPIFAQGEALLKFILSRKRDYQQTSEIKSS